MKRDTNTTLKSPKLAKSMAAGRQKRADVVKSAVIKARR